MPEPPPSSSKPKELPINRYKFIWRVLMISNLALGAYMFVGARTRDIDKVKRKAVEKSTKNRKAVVEVPPPPPVTTTPSTTTTPTSETWDM